MCVCFVVFEMGCFELVGSGNGVGGDVENDVSVYIYIYIYP